MNPKFSIVVKYKYTCGKCDYTAFLLPFLRQMYLRYCSATQKFCSFFFYCTHMHIVFLGYPFLSVFPIYIWCVLEKRFLFPISQAKFSPNPIFLVTALFKFYFFCFFADESQSHCIESNFPYKKISTFQFPFYLFRILSK